VHAAVEPQLVLRCSMHPPTSSAIQLTLQQTWPGLDGMVEGSMRCLGGGLWLGPTSASPLPGGGGACAWPTHQQSWECDFPPPNLRAISPLSFALTMRLFVCCQGNPRKPFLQIKNTTKEKCYRAENAFFYIYVDRLSSVLNLVAFRLNSMFQIAFFFQRK